MNDADWPTPSDSGQALELYKAKLEARKAERARLDALDDSAQKQTDQLLVAIHAAYIEVTKAGIDRSLTRATYLTTAAGSIVTLYTGLLALVYSVAVKPPLPLPARGLVPALFIASAFVFSAAYVAFLRRHTWRGRPLPAGLGGDIDEQRLVTYIAWVSASVQQRAWAIRIAVISLGIGVAWLPLPFLRLSDKQTLAASCAGAAILAAWIIFGELIGGRRLRSAFEWGWRYVTQVPQPRR